jgi:predicted DNA-binding transcriptional regulator AlpA
MTPAFEPNAATIAKQEFLTDDQLANLLRITTRTTMRWRRDGGGPPFIRCGSRRVLYDRQVVEAWLRQRSFAHRAAESIAGEPSGK